MHLIFLAPPGAGKGTQSAMIFEHYGVRQLSTGDILRYHNKMRTPMGIKAMQFMDKGELVPDEIIIEMIKAEFIKDEYKNGVIFDGFPRTVPQAIALDKFFEEINSQLSLALILEVPKEELMGRLVARRVCRKCGKSYHLIFTPPKEVNTCDPPCGGELFQRPDDSKETILNRLKIYHDQTEPLVEYYKSKGIAASILGLGSVYKVFERIADALKEKELI